VAGIIDGNGNFVARVPPLASGRPASPAFRAETLAASAALPAPTMMTS